MTFAELQAEALHDDFDATKYRALVKRWLNQALHRVARRLKLPEREGAQAINTVAGTSFYALNATIVRVRSLRFAGVDYGELDQVDLRDIDELPSTSRGKPSVYAFNGAGVTLYPIPDKAYALELRHWANATDLANDADVPGIPVDYHDLLVTYARSKLFEREDDGEMAAFYMNQFESGLQQMRSDVQDRGGGKKRTPGMWATTGSPRFARP